MSGTLGAVNPSSPESIIASARALAAMGSHREAECMLRGALARLPSHGAFRLALMGLSVDAAAGSWPPLTLAQVEQWICDGMLVEALAALCGCSFGEDGQCWSDLLGELLAPPPDAGDEHRGVHQSLLRGGASVAMTTLEDMSLKASLSPWAERRLRLLRWMLIDNAKAAPRDSQVDLQASPLAHALFAPLEARDLAGMADAAKAVDHPDAELTAGALERLAREVQKQGSPETADKRTVAHNGRTAAAMQLHMTSFETARALYEQLLTKAAEPEVAQLLVAVQGIERVLTGRPYIHRSFAAPKANRFDDVTARHPEQRALASTPAAIGGTREGLGFDDQTRVAASAEIPLAAFGDEETRSVVLPEAKIKVAPYREFGNEVTRVDARHASSVSEVGFDDITVRRNLQKSPTSGSKPAPAFVTDDTLSIEDSDFARALDAATSPDAAKPSAKRPRSSGTAPLGTISDDDPSPAEQAQARPESVPREPVSESVPPMQEYAEQPEPVVEPVLERAKRNSVIVAAIVSVGVPDKGSLQ